MIIYGNTNRNYGENHQFQISHDFGYKRSGSKKTRNIKSGAVGESTSKSKSKKLITLRKENIQFSSELGFEVRRK